VKSCCAVRFSKFLSYKRPPLADTPSVATIMNISRCTKALWKNDDLDPCMVVFVLVQCGDSILSSG
jgi:hypothetical protein